MQQRSLRGVAVLPLSWGVMCSKISDAPTVGKSALRSRSKNARPIPTYNASTGVPLAPSTLRATFKSKFQSENALRGLQSWVLLFHNAETKVPVCGSEHSVPWTRRCEHVFVEATVWIV